MEAESDSGDGEPVPAVFERTMWNQEGSPNRRFDDRIVIRDTSRTQITATHCEFVNQDTGEVHHHAVKIESQRKYAKSAPRTISVPTSIWIGDEDKDEIRRLRDFLSVVRNDVPEGVGRYLVVRLEEGQIPSTSLYRLIELGSSPEKAESLVVAIEGVSADPVALRELVELGARNPDVLRSATAALNLGRYREALSTLRRKVDSNALESDFQSHLEEHPWLFGSEYSERLEIRRATRDEIQDFIVRRTTDDYIEIVEIKRTLEGTPLFNWDKDHKSYFPSVPLAKVIGQVVNYIEELDASRSELLRKDGIDTNKIRAKIIIGRSGDQGQLEALRNLNGHLHRIEVLTFDQLVRIGQRILDHLQAVVVGEPEDFATRVQYDESDPTLALPTWDESEPPF